MDRVRSIRNDIAHFQGHVDTLETGHPTPGGDLAGESAHGPAEDDRDGCGAAPACKRWRESWAGANRWCASNRVVHWRRAAPDDLQSFRPIARDRRAWSSAGHASQQGILAPIYLTEGVVDLLDLPVLHCDGSGHDPAQDDDLFTAANLLTRRASTPRWWSQDDKPIGMLTGKDMTHFFRSLFEGIILIERIETRLRGGRQRGLSPTRRR